MPEQFEDLVVFQNARKLSKTIHRMTKFPKFRDDRDLAVQLRRAAISVMSNIGEGFERISPKEFGYFLNIAKGSCGEVRAQLYAVEDNNIETEENLEKLRLFCRTISGQFYKLRQYVVSKGDTAVQEDAATYNTRSD